MSQLLAMLVACAVLIAPVAGNIAWAQSADAVAQARGHYQRGTNLFSAGDYKGAIAEYAAADKLAPSALLEFNIALCYDRMGDRAEALRRYRMYLREMPTANNRVSVEGKVKRLEGEIRQEQEAERKKREAAAAAAAAAKPAPVPAAPVPAPVPEVNPEDIVIPEVAPEVTPEGPVPTEVYTPGMEGTAEPAPAPSEVSYQSNDPELARVAAIDVGAIRDQRGSSGGYNVGGSAVAYNSDPGSDPGAEPVGPNGENTGANMGGPAEDKKASKPIYKQWWFWVVAGVGTIILIDFATSDSSSSQNQALMLAPPMQQGAQSTGPLEWRF
tara:strand:+ start:8481 stop:9461 length:981 start_codon:yes stop_codon:yes gene_type:complete